jgi:hypothetical protein
MMRWQIDQNHGLTGGWLVSLLAEVNGRWQLIGAHWHPHRPQGPAR